MGGLLACHSFVSHVTGYATLFGLKLNQSNYLAASGMLFVPVFFLAGTMISGFLIDLRVELQTKPRYYVIFGVLCLLQIFIVIGGFNGFFGRFGEEDYLLVALLCLVCGIQNGTVTLVSKSIVRTTHLTGITTDLGIGIVRVLNSHHLGSAAGEETKANFMRVGIIFFFVLGSMVGYQILNRFEYRGFLFPATISGALFAITFYFQVVKRMIKA